MHSHRKHLIPLASGALALLSLLGYLIWSSYREEIRGAGIASRNYAAIIEARLDASLRRTDAELQRLVFTIPVASLNRDALSRHAQLNSVLKASLLQFPELVRIGIFDDKGERLYASTRPLTQTLNISDRSYFQMLRDNPQVKLVVSDIDDDAMPLSLFKRCFERRGYRVTGYTDARAALDALRADPAAFDLVLTDYNMPGLSGLEVAREVQMIRADLPVAVLSGFIDEALHAQADAAGVRTLISKADPVEAIYKAVQRLTQASGVKSAAC